MYPAPSALGTGLFASGDRTPGQLLFRFEGPLISRAEVNEKGDLEGNPVQIGPETYMDVKPPGVFINHSCDPNAGLYNLVEVRALRQIRAGEEVRIDYSTTMSEKRWTMVCRCGHDGCRGTIGDFHDLPAPLQERYLALGIVQPFIREEVCRGRRLE